MGSLSKWRAVFSLHMQDSFAYRAQGIVWILTDTVPTITIPLMWLAAFGNRTELNGFTRTGLVAYYLVMSVVTNLVSAHPWEVARDIKDGRLSIFLIRPFSYFWFTFASNLSWRLVRTLLFVPFFAIILLVFRRYLVWQSYNVGWQFWASITLSHILCFQMAWVLGLMAFYLVEVSGLYEFWYMLNGFLAGQMAPLQMLPESVRQLAHALPFAYTLWFPVQVFSNRLPEAAVRSGMVAQIIWIMVMVVVARVLWNIGLKRYTAVGI